MLPGRVGRDLMGHSAHVHTGSPRLARSVPTAICVAKSIPAVPETYAMSHRAAPLVVSNETKGYD